jgi:hypothetical protein
MTNWSSVFNNIQMTGNILYKSQYIFINYLLDELITDSHAPDLIRIPINRGNDGSN